MLEVLAIRGDKSTADMAKSMLAMGKTIRDDRGDMNTGELVAEERAGVTRFAQTAMLAAPAAVATPRVDRAIYDGGNKAALPGKLIRKEGDSATGDADADEAYDGAGHVFDLYLGSFGRNSLDGAGMKLKHTVHHRKGFNNAFWEGSQMVYGDGDDRIFSRFTELSVIGHEMSHGVVQFSGGLRYAGQSGALNESFADVFGALTVQRKLGQRAADADWLIGAGIFAPGIRGTALRSMKAPGTAYADALLGQDPQPYHMSLYVNTPEDNGGVHINSGIPNHAFYLYAQYLGGNAWEKPGTVWYKALQTLNNPLASFSQWAAQTLDVATSQFGIGSFEAIMLKRAWRLVGISI
jgi:Zn-dependent metalloprotease